MPATAASIRKITRGFQVTLPPHFRERFGLQEGDAVTMVEEGNQLVIRPLPLSRAGLLDQFDAAVRALDTTTPAMTEARALTLATTEKRAARRSRRSN